MSLRNDLFLFLLFLKDPYSTVFPRIPPGLHTWSCTPFVDGFIFGHIINLSWTVLNSFYSLEFNMLFLLLSLKFCLCLHKWLWLNCCRPNRQIYWNVMVFVTSHQQWIQNSLFLQPSFHIWTHSWESKWCILILHLKKCYKNAFYPDMRLLNMLIEEE